MPFFGWSDALGSLAAELLCRAGVGEFILLDRNYVELYTEADAEQGRLKVHAAVPGSESNLDQ